MAATARTVDLSDVKDGGSFRPRRKPEGDYKAKVVKADDHQPKDKSKQPGWVLTIQVDGDARSTYPYYLSPEKNQAWKIGAICRAAKFNTKAARIRFDPNKLVGKAIGIALVDEEYNDRLKSVIDDVFTVDEVGSADEGPEVDDEIYEDDEEVVEDDVTDEEPEDEDEEEEEPAPAPAPKRRRAAPKPAPEPEPEDDEDEPEDEEEYEDEDEEPEPEPVKPAPRKRAAAPAAKKAAPRKPAPVVEDDDLDLDDLDD